jgi:hypothetical protein
MAWFQLNLTAFKQKQHAGLLPERTVTTKRADIQSSNEQKQLYRAVLFKKTKAASELRR